MLKIHRLRYGLLILINLSLLALLRIETLRAAGEALIVYNNASYSGMYCYSPSADINNIGSGCNDQISSISLVSGWSVRVYRDANQGGSSQCFSSSDANLADNVYEDGSAMNDTISSFILYQATNCPALEVHNEAGYKGMYCYSPTADTNNIATDCNDQVSSILLRPGWAVRMYRDSNQGGPSRCFTESDTDLTDNTYEDGSAINDTASSFVLQQGSCPTAPAPVLQVNPTSLSFSATQGSSNPAAQSFTISNGGTGTLNWTTSSNVSWLVLSSTSGAAPATVNASVNISGLSAGTYNGTITINSEASGSPKTVEVTFVVNPISRFVWNYGDSRNWYIYQGYNSTPVGGTHPGPQFDVTIGTSTTSTGGVAVYAPASGKVDYLGPSHGDVRVKINNSTVCYHLAHLDYASSLYWGKPIQQGEYLGTVASPGIRQNNGVSHVHMELRQGQCAVKGGYTPIPFTGDWGINGISYPSSGIVQEHKGKWIYPNAPVNNTIMPGGRLLTPADKTTIGPEVVNLSAEAWSNPGGSPVNRVEFHVYYGGWHHIGTDYSPPYTLAWTTPEGLSSQQLIFTIHIIDQAGNRIMDPGGYRWVNFEMAQGNPSVIENRISADKRAYLNQLSLGSDGWKKCSAASMTMAMAMNGLLSSDYETMAAKANQMYPNVVDAQGIVWVYLVTNELNRQGALAKYHNVSANAGWTLIKQEIDAGRSIIIRTSPGVMTVSGHYFVVVGYREVGSVREISVYDPYGRWLGNCCESNYDSNSQDPGSYKGQTSYNYDQVFGSSNYLISVYAPGQTTALVQTTGLPSTPPDLVSDEPENIVTYQGTQTGEGGIYLPLIIK